MGSPTVLSAVRFGRSLVFCVVFLRSFVCPFIHLLATVLSILIQFTDYDYPFWYLQT
jgi:hypothetical protein